MKDEDAMILAYIVVGALVFGLSAGAVFFDMAIQTKAGTGESFYLLNQGNGTYLERSNLTSGVLHSSLNLGIPVGDCYKVQLGYSFRPFNGSLSITKASLAYCQ